MLKTKKSNSVSESKQNLNMMPKKKKNPKQMCVYRRDAHCGLLWVLTIKSGWSLFSHTC